MPTELAHYITEYGYWAIFSLVFLQEIGVPNPVSNELVLIFSGYLAWSGLLSFPLVFLTAVAGDVIGTTLLYTIFYHFGEYILAHKPRWIPISREHIEKLTERVSKKGWWGIFVGRLTPFLRGYVSVAAGLIGIPPGTFLPTVLGSALLWSGGYVVIGKIVGPYWQATASRVGHIELFILIGFVIAGFFILSHAVSKKTEHK